MISPRPYKSKHVMKPDKNIEKKVKKEFESEYPFVSAVL